MCCFPFSDVEYEDEPQRAKLLYVWDGQSYVLHRVYRKMSNLKQKNARDGGENRRRVSFSNVVDEEPGETHVDGREHRRRVSFSDLVEGVDGMNISQPSHNNTISPPENHTNRGSKPDQESRDRSGNNEESAESNGPNNTGQENSYQGRSCYSAQAAPFVPTGGQKIFTHHTGGPQPGPDYHTSAPFTNSAYTQGHYGNLHGNPTWHSPPTGQSFNHSAPNMSSASYPNREPPSYGVHFQPQVPDTTNGPYVHTYVPRHDAGVAYMGQPSFPVAAAGVAYPMQTQVAYGMTPMGMGPVVVQQPAPAGMMLPSPPMPIAGGPMGGPVYMQGGPQVAPGNFGPTFAGPPAMAGAMPGVAGGLPSAPEPATGLGLTASEAQMSLAAMLADPENEINQPQDFKPADDSKTRMYPCREVDGNWTVRNRVTIDGLDDTRWYISEGGVFYAVRVAN